MKYLIIFLFIGCITGGDDKVVCKDKMVPTDWCYTPYPGNMGVRTCGLVGSNCAKMQTVGTDEGRQNGTCDRQYEKLTECE